MKDMIVHVNTRINACVWQMWEDVCPYIHIFATG